jgi:hypothetical protein
MTDIMRKRLASVVLGLSLVGGVAAVGTGSLTSAWSEGNNQPQSGLFLQDKDRFTGLVGGSNETHTGSLTALPW